MTKKKATNNFSFKFEIKCNFFLKKNMKWVNDKVWLGVALAGKSCL